MRKKKLVRYIYHSVHSWATYKATERFLGGPISNSKDCCFGFCGVLVGPVVDIGKSNWKRMAHPPTCVAKEVRVEKLTINVGVSESAVSPNSIDKGIAFIDFPY